MLPVLVARRPNRLNLSVAYGKSTRTQTLLSWLATLIVIEDSDSVFGLPPCLELAAKILRDSVSLLTRSSPLLDSSMRPSESFDPGLQKSTICRKIARSSTLGRAVLPKGLRARDRQYLRPIGRIAVSGRCPASPIPKAATASSTASSPT